MIVDIKEVTYSPLSLDENHVVRLTGDELCIDGLKTLLRKEDGIFKLNFDQNFSPIQIELSKEFLFGHLPELKEISINGEVIKRHEFYQVPLLWHHKTIITPEKERWTETNGRKHLLRDKPFIGTVYKRYVPKIGKTISFRACDLERDLDLFHEWHNQPRVSHFWELNKSKDELRDYLAKGLQDPHLFPMMLEFDNRPVGYYEIYWVAEDRLGPYYDCAPSDRGFHLLIGNTQFLGYENTNAVLNAGLHFMFLDDPRTQNVMAEPRHDNKRIIRYAEAAKGWRIVKEFDFPHKRAALLECNREGFFRGEAL